MDQSIKVGMKAILDDDKMPTTTDGEFVGLDSMMWYAASMQMRKERITKSLLERDRKLVLCGTVKPFGEILKDIDHMNFLIDTFGMASHKPIIGIVAPDESRINDLMKSAIDTVMKTWPDNVIVIDSVPGGE